MDANRFRNISEVERVFSLQHTNSNLQLAKTSSPEERAARISDIESYLLDDRNLEALIKALNEDLGRGREESIVIELLPLFVALKNVRSEIHDWVSSVPTKVPLAMAGISSRIRYEPKGHVLIIAPWNFPLQLALLPLIHAIAAGNVVLLKPSEISASTSAFILRMMREIFDEHRVAVVEGDVPTTQALLKKPFHHVFFTGSTQVGKLVMKAAAENLASVTLELGGKSPVIVDETFDAVKAGHKLAWAKGLNAGQSCMSPDYVLIHQSKMNAFLRSFENNLKRMYYPDGKGLVHSHDYSRIINERHFQRLKGLLDDAMAKGARIAFDGGMDEGELFMGPHVLLNVTSEMKLMQEEIFGPLLPMIPFESLGAVPSIIAERDRPLTLYILSNSRRNVDYVLERTNSGGVGINELMILSSNPHLPFGGINQSGIGRSNGFRGFVEFSNERGVLERKWGSFAFAPVHPPFRPILIKAIKRLARL